MSVSCVKHPSTEMPGVNRTRSTYTRTHHSLKHGVCLVPRQAGCSVPLSLHPALAIHGLPAHSNVNPSRTWQPQTGDKTRRCAKFSIQESVQSNQVLARLRPLFLLSPLNFEIFRFISGEEAKAHHVIITSLFTFLHFLIAAFSCFSQNWNFYSVDLGPSPNTFHINRDLQRDHIRWTPGMWVSARREGGSRLVRLQWFCPSFFLTHRT